MRHTIEHKIHERAMAVNVLHTRRKTKQNSHETLPPLSRLQERRKTLAVKRHSSISGTLCYKKGLCRMGVSNDRYSEHGDQESNDLDHQKGHHPKKP